ncbi:MAG: ATP-binding protein [Acidobacteriota bacterium]|jgi:anti-sigma regulatory factor (Ser/Thr protein kinase)
MNYDIRLEVRSDPRHLGLIRTLIHDWVDGFGLPHELVHDVVLAIDEACSNVIRHAYEGRGDGPLEIRLLASPEHLEFEVRDQGVPCPPECHERRPLEPPDANALQPGGLGVQLMHQVFDQVVFCPGKNRGNCVTMKLRRKR